MLSVAMAPSDEPLAALTVRAEDCGSSLERIARAQLGAGTRWREVDNYVGQLFELNNIASARRIQSDQIITLPGTNTAAASNGLGAHGRDIATGEQITADRLMAQAQQQVQASADHARYDAMQLGPGSGRTN